MRKIGLLSDTHNVWDEKYETYFAGCDEIWHAGISAPWSLRKVRSPQAVPGGIREYRRLAYAESLPGNLTVYGGGGRGADDPYRGYPGKYDPKIRAQLYSRPPKLFICGHSIY